MTETDKLAKLKQQQEKIARKIRSEKTRISKQARADDTRRKIILGALVIKASETDSQLQEKTNRLVQSLKRDDERALFGLPSLPENENNGNAPAAAGQESEPLRKSGEEG